MPIKVAKIVRFTATRLIGKDGCGTFGRNLEFLRKIRVGFSQKFADALKDPSHPLSTFLSSIDLEEGAIPQNESVNLFCLGLEGALKSMSLPGCKLTIRFEKLETPVRGRELVLDCVKEVAGTASIPYSPADGISHTYVQGCLRDDGLVNQADQMIAPIQRLIEMGESEKASAMTAAAIKLSKKITDPVLKADSQIYIAGLLAQMGRYGEANEACDRALKTFEQNADLSVFVEKTDFIKTLIQLKRYQEAVKLINKIVEMVQLCVETLTSEGPLFPGFEYQTFRDLEAVMEITAGLSRVKDLDEESSKELGLAIERIASLAQALIKSRPQA